MISQAKSSRISDIRLTEETRPGFPAHAFAAVLSFPFAKGRNVTIADSGCDTERYSSNVVLWQKDVAFREQGRVVARLAPDAEQQAHS